MNQNITTAAASLSPAALAFLPKMVKGGGWYPTSFDQAICAELVGARLAEWHGFSARLIEPTKLAIDVLASLATAPAPCLPLPVQPKVATRRAAKKQVLPATADCSNCTKANGISSGCSHCGGHGWQVLRGANSAFPYYDRPRS